MEIKQYEFNYINLLKFKYIRIILAIMGNKLKIRIKYFKSLNNKINLKVI